MKRILIGLGGKPRHGKDTAASAIAREFPEAKIYSISDLICSELGVKRADVKDASALQEHSHRRCSKDPLYWSRQIAAAVKSDAAPISILTNVRRWDEAQWYVESGWRLVRIIALNPNGSLYIPRDRDMNDPLETELDGFNWEFRIIARKPGQKRWLERQAVGLVRELMEEEK